MIAHFRVVYLRITGRFSKGDRVAKQGRKPVGPEIKVALPKEMLDTIESCAAVLGKSRTEFIRVLLDDALTRLNHTTEGHRK